MTDQTLSNRVKETLKLRLRTSLMRADLDLTRDPWSRRVVRMADAHGIDTIVDIGANVGQFGSLMRSAGFSGRIVSVEPLSTANQRLVARASGDRRWDTVRAAVGPGVVATINVSANSYSSSLLEMSQTHLDVAPASVVIDREEVPMVSVERLVADKGIVPERTLLKVDTQGYEGAVLDSAAGLLDQFAAVQLELSLVELYHGQPLMDALTARLATHGLDLFAASPGISDSVGRMLQMDGLFVRSPR